MKTRAIANLGQLSDIQFFKKVSDGLQLVLSSAERLNADAELMAEQERARSCSLLTS